MNENSLPVHCHDPYCRELLALLRHGEIRIRPVFAGRDVESYHVDWIDAVSGRGQTYSGDGETLQGAIEAAVIDRFGILAPYPVATG
jgi:hypothetical protein